MEVVTKTATEIPWKQKSPRPSGQGDEEYGKAVADEKSVQRNTRGTKKKILERKEGYCEIGLGK